MKRCGLNLALVGLVTFLVNGPDGRGQPSAPQGQSPCRLVDYVSPSVLQSNTSSITPISQTLFPPVSTNQAVASPIQLLSSVDRWEQFEAEFGVRQQKLSFVIGTIELAKYKLDETVFAAKKFVDTLHYSGYLKDVVGGSDSNAPPRRYYSDPIRDAWENAEIRSGVDWDAHSQGAFVGVRLVLPVGD